MMQELVITQFPLQGARLIEASAGTGKTYTISGLYLRLLLEKQLTVTQILVVTFTEAATQELRGRIRQRLYDALRWLEGKTGNDDFEQMLQPYKGDRKVLQQLRDAVTRMDEASVFTIHGFCQRTLTDSAFESGVLFDAEFVTDESELREQIARDFWRRRVAEEDAGHVKWVIEKWKTPGALLSDIGALIANPGIKVSPDVSTKSVHEMENRKRQLFEQFRKKWQDVEQEIKALLFDSAALGRAKDSYRPDKLECLFATMPDFVSQAEAPAELPQYFELLTQSMISDPASHKTAAVRKGAPIPAHSIFELSDQLARVYTILNRDRRVLFMLEAAEYMYNEIGLRKEKNRILFFDDLLSKLDSALMGKGGDDLAARIRAQYPVAMIDEFQDTDPLQYRIFSRIYKDIHECGLFMIGDPKQAIYSFRGADIFTYMQARHDTDAASGHFTLDTNFRSHTSLIEGINAIFQRASAPFIYKDEIDFYPVNPAGEKGRADKTPLLLNGEVPSPLVCWQVPRTADNTYQKTITKKWAGHYVARGCAAEISHLLNLGQRGEAKIGERNLAAHDIAILVRDRFEAANVRDALTELGIASVYISRDSVFDTEEARDLAHLLRAVAEPANATLMRTAMATRLLGLTAREIHELNDYEIAWEEKVLAFQDYHKIWNRQGFMPMFQHLLRNEGVSARVLSLDDGERRMTNLLQLAELAQCASARHAGIERLLRWLADERAESDGNVEDQQLRMESDEDLVQIVTIHKSKGLEYEVVFLPFIWGSKEVKDDNVLIYHDEQERTLQADLGSLERREAKRLAEKERLAEELRLLYVALTRAKYRCYFSWGQFNGAANSALAYLLHQRKNEETGEVECIMASLEDDAIRRDLDRLNGDDAAYLSVEELPGFGAPFRPLNERVSHAEALLFTGDTRQAWRMTSFSGMTMGSAQGKEYRVELPDHDQEMDLASQGAVQAEVLSSFNFPRGAKAGRFLHQLFEKISFPSAGREVLSGVVSKGIEQYGFDEKWHETVVDWLTSILATPLNTQTDLLLRNIPDHKRLVELEFHFPLMEMEASAINAILARSRGEGRQSPALEFFTISGMMKGYIDLIFEHDGRFYVLDYKSNHLGNRFDDYQTENLKHVIDEHYYDLQYLIYTLTLHRYLKTRIPGYDYDRHIGGVYYLFLRGMHPMNGPRTGAYFVRPSRDLIEALEQSLCGREPEVMCA